MKTKTKIYFFLLFVFISNLIYSQDFNNYTELKSSGEIPADFLTLANDSYTQDKNNISGSEKRNNRKLKEQFYLESNYSIIEFLKSGNVLFNDPVTNYINEVYEKIKIANPFLNDENIRFYTCKSTIVNAYTTHSGIIFINIGLIAKLKTEDELAYIMCHEISHYIENHSINQYTFNDKIDSEKGSYKKTSWDTKLFSKSNYSQVHELIADSLGVIMYSNTDYCINSPIDALGNLKTFNYPFADRYQFKKSFLVNDYFSLTNTNLTPLDSIDVKSYSEDDDFLTHPDIDYRIIKVTDQLNDPAYDVDSLKTSKTPNKFQKLAQFELPHLFIEKGMSSHALYCTFALLNKYPENNYLKNYKCKLLYMISQNATCKEFNDDDDLDNFKSTLRGYKRDMKYYPAEIQQLNLFISKLTDQQKSSLAITNLWKNISQGNNDKTMDQRLRDLTKMRLLYYPESNEINELIKNDTLYGNIYSEEEDNSKNEIKEKHEKKYEDIQENVTVSNRISKNNSSVTQEKQNIDNNQTSEKDNNSSKKDNNKNNDSSESNINYELGKIIFIEPEYRQFDMRKDNPYNYQASEKEMINYQNKVTNNASLLDIEYSTLSPFSLNATDVDLLNDISLLNSFIEENNSNSPWTINTKKEEIDKLITKYNSDKIAYVGTYTFHMDKDVGSAIYSIFISCFLPPVLPFAVWSAVTPEHRTFTYVLLYNLSSEKIDYYEVEYMRMKGNEGVINSTMYYNLMKLKEL